MEATELFESTIEWLRSQYASYRFFTERDVVWTIQLRMLEELERTHLPYRVVNEYGFGVGGPRADLVVLAGGSVEVAAEFKYEPSHARKADRGGDIWSSKLNPSAVFWSDSSGRSVIGDVRRVQAYVEQGEAKAAHFIFIDEGGHFRWRGSPHGSKWIDWPGGISVLWSKVPA